MLCELDFEKKKEASKKEDPTKSLRTLNTSNQYLFDKTLKKNGQQKEDLTQILKQFRINT